MSITAAFANLNSAINGIRESKQAHQRRMFELENQKMAIQEKINDPRERLAKSQAAAENEMGELTFGFEDQTRSLSQQQAWEGQYHDLAKSVLPEGVILNDERVPVWKDTGQRVQMPKWRRDRLRANMDIAMTMGSLGDFDLNHKIEQLTQDVQATEKAISGRASDTGYGKLMGPKLKNKRAALADLIEKRDDPEQRYQRLIGDNEKVNTIYKKALANPNIDGKVLQRLDDYRTANINEMKALAKGLGKEGDATGLTTITYTWRDPATGETRTRNYVTPKWKANAAPAQMMFNDGRLYDQGTIKGGLPDKESELTWTQKHAINQRVARAEMILSKANQEWKQEDNLIDILKQGDPNMTDEEAERYDNLIRTNAKSVVESQQEILDSLNAAHKNSPWYIKNIKADKLRAGDSLGGRTIADDGWANDSKTRLFLFEDGTITDVYGNEYNKDGTRK